MKCPNCKSEEIKTEWMTDCGEEFKILRCKCGWYGDSDEL